MKTRSRFTASLAGLAAAAALAVVGLSGCAGAPGSAGASPSASASDSTMSLLFMFSANGGTVSKINDTDYAVSLSGTSDRMTWFSDRPNRAAGTVRFGVFVKAWPLFSFDTNPPNIGLTAGPDDAAQSVVATMLEPKFDPASNTFSATLRVLPEHSSPALPGTTPPPTIGLADLPATLSNVSVFIDDATTPCNPNLGSHNLGAGASNSIAPIMFRTPATKPNCTSATSQQG